MLGSLASQPDFAPHCRKCVEYGITLFVVSVLRTSTGYDTFKLPACTHQILNVIIRSDVSTYYFTDHVNLIVENNGYRRGCFFTVRNLRMASEFNIHYC